MRIHKDSHVDHGLTQAQLSYLLQRFGDHDKFFLVTIDLPEDLGTVPCGLYGPLMGDAPVTDDEVTYSNRMGRQWPTRFIEAASRQTRQVTLIAGPHDGEPCVLYTVYGGPSAPQEPGDPACRDKAASEAFWATHALAKF